MVAFLSRCKKSIASHKLKRTRMRKLARNATFVSLEPLKGSGLTKESQSPLSISASQVVHDVQMQGKHLADEDRGQPEYRGDRHTDVGFSSIGRAVYWLNNPYSGISGIINTKALAGLVT